MRVTQAVPDGAVRPARDLSWSHRMGAGRHYARAPIQVPWLHAGDDLSVILSSHASLFDENDTLAVSEKVVVLLTGRAIPISTMAPRRLAVVLAGRVRPRCGSRGLSVPEKMEYVLRSVGTARVLGAVIASALTRPLRVHGAFYRIAGDVARDIDGGRPPYEDLLFPPLATDEAEQLCAELEGAVGVGIAIVDMNDFGGTIRATSSRALSAPVLQEILADNPLRQRLASTPFAIVRPV
jgi:F420-0:gamma-glutamyl ligase